MEKKMNIIIVGINPDSGNRGVGALAYSIIYLLNNISKESGLKFNIFVAGTSKMIVKREVNVGDTKIEIAQFPLLVGKGVKGALKFLFSMMRSYKIILNTKCILDMGEGDSFSDIYSESRFISINGPKKIFRLLRKRQLLLPQTIGPFKDKKIAKEAKKSLEKSDVVLTRDRMSYNYVLNNTTQKNVKELIDVAFFMPFTKRIFKNEKINVGLNISSLMWHGGYTKDNQFGFKVDYPNLTRSVIDYFLSQPNVQVHLVPHVVGALSHVENDYELSRMVLDEYDTDRITLAPFFLDPIDAKNYISGLIFFAGARMHACIAAFSAGVPVFPIAYSRKFNGLFVESLEYPFMGDLINQTEEDFMEGLKFAFSNRTLLNEKIKWSMDNVVAPRYVVLMEELKMFFELK
jgi:colanic acid/amylovoran biosynthesis protein